MANLSGGYTAPTMFFALLLLYRCNYFLRNSVGACDPQCAGVLVGAEITTIFLESHLFTEVEWFWENGLLEIPTYFNKELVDCIRVPIFSKIGYSVGIFFNGAVLFFWHENNIWHISYLKSQMAEQYVKNNFTIMYT